ncbi:MAG: hypothetical protein QXJ45_06075 [Thermoproteota archaeon]
MSISPEEIEKIRKELCSYSIGKQELCVVVDPLIKACTEISKDKKDLEICIKEAYNSMIEAMRSK